MITYINVFVLFYSYCIASSVSASSNLSLSFPQLHEWKSVNASTKIYNYTIAGNVTTLECLLSNPSQDGLMTYKLRFYLDDQKLRGSDVNISASLNGSIKQTINIKETSKTIICTAGLIIKNNTKEARRNEIILNHIRSLSPPSLSINGPPKLLEAEYLAHNFTQTYIYNFTDGESLTLDCSLAYPQGSEVYDLTYYIGDEYKMVKVEGPKTSQNRQTFVLKKENTVITCLAENRGVNLPKTLTNIVHLKYSPSLTGSSSGWLKWSLGVFTVLLSCSVVLCVVVNGRENKPDIEPTYANFTRDQNYLTMPTPDPKVMPSSSTCHKPKMIAEHLYCEIQEPPDTKADPKKLISELPYAVPYDQSNYSEPYAARSDGPYAEPYVPQSVTSAARFRSSSRTQIA